MDVTDVGPLGALGDIANLGLRLLEAKQIWARLQRAVVEVQAEDHEHRASGLLCSRSSCHVKGWRLHQLATLFGTVAVRLPRFRCAG
jgi:hypothetical protein